MLAMLRSEYLLANKGYARHKFFVWIIKRKVTEYFILYHVILLSFEDELRHKKSGFLYTLYAINVKTNAQISCAVTALPLRV